MELIDVLDENGARTGVTKPKAEVHRDGDWHRSVHVWIITPDGRLLVQRRALVKENNPGLWDVSCAGHVSAGEPIVESAIREAREELGLELHADELLHIATLREQSVLNGGTYIENEFHEIFIVRRAVDLATLTLQPEEVDDVQIVTPDQLPLLDMVPHPGEYALIAKRAISGG